jgi:hypothetical protein
MAPQQTQQNANVNKSAPPVQGDWSNFQVWSNLIKY